MSDDLPENPPPATTPPAAPAQQPAANVLDTPEVRAAIAAAEERARNATWKQARETLTKKPTGNAPQPESQPAAQPAAQTQTSSASSLDIARVVMFTTEATKHGIPPKGVEMLLSRLDTEKPADVSAWVAQQASDYGWKPPTNATSTPAAPTQAPAPLAPTNATPVTGNAAPMSPVTVTADTPMFSRSEAERVAFLGGNVYAPNMAKVVEYTDALMAEARRGARLTYRR